MSIIEDAIGEAAELARHLIEIARIASIPPGRHGRGLVLPLTSQQRVQRALYIAKLADISTLDMWIPRAGAPARCPDIYYLLHEHNGGKDPTRPDPADRWHKDGSTFENRTCDCIGAASWIGGWDRYQPIRFAHIYKGWINTDSMRLDAGGPAKCFRKIDAPVPGCYVVCATGSPGHPNAGHIGTVVGGCEGFDRKNRDSWLQLEVVDVAKRDPNPANALTTGRGWYGADAWFVVPTMKP